MRTGTRRDRCRIFVAAAAASVVPVLLVTLQFARDFEAAGAPLHPILPNQVFIIPSPVLATSVAAAKLVIPTSLDLTTAPVVKFHRIFADLYTPSYMFLTTNTQPTPLPKDMQFKRHCLPPLPFLNTLQPPENHGMSPQV